MVLIRLAKPADAAAIARIHVESWQAAYRGLMPDALLDGLDIRQKTERWNEIFAKGESETFVAERTGAITGFCTLMPSRDADAGTKSVGEIAAIYVSPRYWRQGAGRRLCEHALAEARNDGYAAVTLWVLTTNTPAREFYEALGFRTDGATRIDQRHGPELHDTRYRLAL